MGNIKTVPYCITNRSEQIKNERNKFANNNLHQIKYTSYNYTEVAKTYLFINTDARVSLAK